ncbi:TRAP transporter large permease [Cellulosilyticum sp. I15G10I2]|uniref:TRAP transporter large permease n=1 Tax=Cellulosilyticum sp. I15G10I2 TaxID=1892843 RepID=UPI00085BDDCD|nr:TRAP transporter large permease [Cellulosilyticum sp. I15G10I2]
MQTSFLIWLFVSFVILVIMGIPLAYSLFLSSALAMIVASDLPSVLIMQQMQKGIDSFPILAIPIFFVAGDLMNRGRVSEYLIRVCLVFVGWIRGALAYFTVIVAMIFAGTTGSSAAESAAIGSIFIPNLVKKGYDKAFAVVLVACASVIGIIIPPSTFMIIYGSFGNVSVVALFIAGILPGTLIGLSLIAISAYYAKKYDYPKEMEHIAKPREMFEAVKKGIWPLGVPVLLIGGMVAGIFTPTEASIVTVVYTLIIILFIYKTLKPRDLIDIVKENALASAIPLFCLSCAGIYGYLLAYYKVPDMVGDAVAAFTTNPNVIMTFIIISFLVIGTFMDGTPAIIVMLPITQKLGQIAGFHPVHLGLIVCLTIALGLLTPPYGLCTLISCAIGKVKLTDAIKPLIPMFGTMLALVLILAYFPDVALFLPRLLVPNMVP